ncbi:glutamate-cysteine ligase regulatory subunit [Schizosaccharomyces japonicus yFS275]|uniref:GCS light chain n=1 Tax=Schizosaccharomyces japonicus (strain yFS275 / FY16936) TaxID=402676 RepID=B6K4D8_SCHJY|nr:glutamate-cysteine ligase regulatory subunit [Schizosaccharomyces japonicus yFS275]EEB08345.1 glutamate-cysteine ligase regulatory subunit [Schizosaccharomyces japonicus yFS275]
MGCSKHVILCTGDVTKELRSGIWNATYKKSNLELVKSLASARLTARNDVLDVPVEGLTVFAPENEAFTTPKDLSDSYEVYVKLFFLDDGKIDLNERKKTIDEVFEALKAVLKIDHVTTLIASFPHISFTHDSVCVSHDKTYASFKEVSPEERQSWVDTWKLLEEKVKAKKVDELSVSEFGVQELQYLLPRVSIRPASTQVNVGSMVKLPRELVEYAEAEHIKLFIHADCSCLLNSDEITSFVQSACPTDEKRPVHAKWVCRYTVLSKTTSVIDQKGYFVSGETE